MIRRAIVPHYLGLSRALVWGAIELLALLRSRWSNPGRSLRG